MPSLVVERGQEKGFTFAVSRSAATVVGRDPASEIVISDPAASRRHFQIRDDGGTWFVTDLGSRNLTYVNEEVLEPNVDRPLEFGDRVQVGETVFSFLEEEKSAEGKAQGLAGKDIGGYKILERIGRGGMGTVYKARQISLNRIVALKILSVKYAKDPSFVQGFVAEARAAGQLQHPNVVQVFDVGQAGGLHFFSMEFMEGGAVQDLLHTHEGSRLHWTEAMPMILDATQGLVYAEKQGIIHRDIKPDNLMLSPEGRVKIGDLGLATDASDAGSGKIFGTPHFIAPEQARGKELNHSADIYSLGASFYRMVSGRTPFSGTTVKEILRKQINEPHVPLTQEVEEFPEDLSAIVDKMMSKDVAARYGSPTELIEDLKAFELAHQIELAGGVKKLNKPLLIGAALVIIGLIAAVVHFVNKDPEIIEKPPVIIQGEDTGISQDAMDAANKRQRVLEARNDYLALVAEKPLGDAALDEEDAWRAKADKFDALAKKHDGTPSANDATRRANEIREQLDELAKIQRATTGVATTWWAREKSRVETAIEEEDWTEALKLARTVGTSREAKQNLQFVPQANKFLTEVEPRVLRAARASQEGCLGEAEKLFANGDPAGAIQLVAAWEARMRKHAPAHVELKNLADSAIQWIDGKKEGLIVGLEQQLLEDRFTYVAASRAIRPLAGSAEPTVGGIEDFQFGAAAKQLDEATRSLKTWIYQDRSALRLTRLLAMESGWKGFVQAVAEHKLVTLDEPLAGLPRVGSKDRATLSDSRPVNDEGFMVDVKIGRGSAGRIFKWAELSAGEIYSIFLSGRLDRVDPALAIGLAWLYTEHFHPMEARALFERGADTLAPADRSALDAEIKALEGYQSLTDEASTPDQVIARVAIWRQRHIFSESFIALDGRPVADLGSLVPSAVIKAFLETYGVAPPDTERPERPKPR